MPPDASAPPAAGPLVYRPALPGRGRIHFVRATYKVDVWQRRTLVAFPAGEVSEQLWDEAASIDDAKLELRDEGLPDSRFPAVPAELLQAKSYAGFGKRLKESLYRTQKLTPDGAQVLMLRSSVFRTFG